MTLQNTIKAIEREQIETVKKLVEPLDIQKIKTVDYAAVAQNIGTGLCSPILVPLGVVCTLLSGLSGNRTLGTVGGFGLASPILAYGGLREMVEPSRQYMKIGNQDALTTCNDGFSPAIVIVNKPSITGSASDKFPWLDVILPSGHNWFLTYGPYYSGDINYSRAAAVDENAYNSSRYFLKADPEVQSKLVALVEEEKVLKRKMKF